MRALNAAGAGNRTPLYAVLTPNQTPILKGGEIHCFLAPLHAVNHLPFCVISTGKSGGRVYYSEILPGFQMNANATSYDVDPMVVVHGSNHGPSSHNSRKRREEDECARGGASISNCYDKNKDLSYDSESKRLKAKGSNEDNEDKVDTEGNSGKAADQPQKPAEQPKQDYIHVRARRGQATDSHSLAERVRREKISERMKILQDIVPG